MTYHAVKVALIVDAESPQAAAEWLYEHSYLPRRDTGWMDDPDHVLDQWWVAEDWAASVKGGCEALVFVPDGLTQEEARRILEAAVRGGE